MRISGQDQIQDWLPTELVRRETTSLLIKSLFLSEITVLYGPRQVGKSIEVTLCIKYLLETGKPDIFYFNLDYPERNMDNPEKFINFIENQRKSKTETVYIFLDEAQKLENIGVFVKYIYDRHLNIKFFLTGSASLEIRQKVKEPLTGRKVEFFLAPLGLDEILAYRGVNMGKLQGAYDLVDQVLEEYLLYGGYPYVVVAKLEEDKVRKLAEIAESYVIRDVFDLFKIASQTELRTVAIYLAQNVGGLLSKEGLSQLAGVSKYEVEKIVTSLEKSFIIFLVKPFSQNPVKEMVHRPKVYYYDLGIRNALLRKLDAQLLVGDRGQVFENAMAIQLKNTAGLEYLKYWRTKNQTEVDFVTLGPGGKAKAWEAKYMSVANTSRGLQTFQSRYQALVEGVSLITKNDYWKIFQT